MPLRLFLFTAVSTWLLSFSPAPAAELANGPRSGRWAHESSTLQPDSRVVWGRLDNGLRFALRPHTGVPGRVSMRLLVLSGSIDEQDDELGMAHFIEHLAFRSSSHFTGEEKIAFFQRLGMEAGSDINAITTFDYTAYMLDFREATPSLLAQGLLLFRDVADGVTFDPAEINKERGVILSEYRGRNGIADRLGFASFAALFKGLHFSNRAPIGTPEMIQAFDRDRFLRFYRRCYRPDLMVIIAAGDFAPEELELMIRDRFDSMVRPEEPIPPRVEGRLDTTRALRAGVYKISDLGGGTATLGSVSPPSGKPDSREAHIETFRRNFAMELLTARLRAAGSDGEASYDVLLGHSTAIAAASVSSEDWAHEIGIMDDLIRFTHQRGFEQREIDVVKRRYNTLAAFMLEQIETLDPYLLCEDLTASITAHTVYVGFEQDYRWLQQWVANVTPRELHQAFQSMWDLDRMAFHLAGDVAIEGGDAEIVRKVQADRRGGMRYFRPDTRRESVFELKRWGQPTTVVERQEVPELGARLMRFGNNVRLNFIPNRAEPGVIYVIVRVGSGLLEMPDDRPALKEFGLQTLLASGTAHFTVEQLGELFEDHVLGFSFDIEDHDAFAFRGTVTTEKIDVLLGIITDFLYRPLFETMVHREEKLKAILVRGLSVLGMQEGMRELNDYLFRGDPRFMGGKPTDYLGLSAIDVREWLQEPLSRGYVEVSVVGDITEENLLRSMSRTLGSLAPRAAQKTLLFKPRPVRITAPAGYQRIEFVGEQHLAQVIGTWPVEAALTTSDKTALHVLTKILEQRINHEIRSELGLAYSPSAQFTPFSGFERFGLIQTSIDCDPSEASRIARLVEEIAAQIATDGAKEGEFMGARGILSGQIRQAFQEGAFLLSLIKRAQERPESVQEAVRLRQGLIDTVTLEEVNAWAKKILPPSNSRTAAVVPKPFIGIFQPTNP